MKRLMLIALLAGATFTQTEARVVYECCPTYPGQMQGLKDRAFLRGFLTSAAKITGWTLLGTNFDNGVLAAGVASACELVSAGGKLAKSCDIGEFGYPKSAELEYEESYGVGQVFAAFCTPMLWWAISRDCSTC